MQKNELELFKTQGHEYNNMFGHFFVPDRDIIIDEEKRKKCLELMKKSCEDRYDYVADYYNIDVEQRKRHNDTIVD